MLTITSDCQITNVSFSMDFAIFTSDKWSVTPSTSTINRPTGSLNVTWSNINSHKATLTPKYSRLWLTTPISIYSFSVTYKTLVGATEITIDTDNMTFSLSEVEDAELYYYIDNNPESSSDQCVNQYTGSTNVDTSAAGTYYIHALSKSTDPDSADSDVVTATYVVDQETHPAPEIMVDGLSISNGQSVYVNLGSSQLWGTVSNDESTPQQYRITKAGTTIDIDASDMPFTIDTAGEYSICALHTSKYGGRLVASDPVTIQAVESAKPVSYYPVTDTDMIRTSATYILASPQLSLAMTADSQSVGLRGTSVNIDSQDNQIIAPSAAVTMLTISGDATSGWQLFTEAGGITLTGSSLEVGGEATTVDIQLADDGTVIISPKDSDNILTCIPTSESACIFASADQASVPVSLYTFTAMDQTTEVGEFAQFEELLDGSTTLPDSDEGQVFYTTTAQVAYAYGDEIWLKDNYSDIITYCRTSNDVSTDNISLGDNIGAFKTMPTIQIGTNYYEAQILSAPQINTPTPGYQIEVLTIPSGIALEEYDLGRMVVVKGRITQLDGNKMEVTSTSGSNTVTYTAIRHFEPSTDDSAASAPRRATTSGYSWSARSDEWPESGDLPSKDLYISGIVGSSDGNSDNLEIYTWKIADNLTNVTTGSQDMLMADNAADYRIEGRSIIANPGMSCPAVYSTDGIYIANPTDLAPGIYIVHSADHSKADKVVIR